MTVAARKGYFAVRDPGGAPINDWEAPALGALEQKPVPNAFPVRAGALRFPERERPGLVPVVVEFKTAPLTFQPRPDGKSYTSDFTVLVRFLDQDNQVVRKVSQHYEVTRPIVAQIERAKQGDVIFYREPELPPGVYTMETIVHDAPSGKSSVRFSTVEVPAHRGRQLRMSSLVLVKRGEKVPEKERRADNPLLVKDVVALSRTSAIRSARRRRKLAFYFAIYPAQGRTRGRTSIIELLQNGKPIAQMPMPVAARRCDRPHPAGRAAAARSAAAGHLRAARHREAGRPSRLSRSTMVRVVD